MEKGRIAKLRSYWHATYFSGHIRWLLMDKDGRGVYCDRCGNIANGIMKVVKPIGIFNVPLCKSHIAESFPEVESCPCIVTLKK